MSAHKTARECISGPVIDGQESEYAMMVDVRRTVSNIEAYAAAKVAEATEALSKENADLRAMLAKASQEEWLKHRAAMARDAEVHSIRTERDAAREANDDLRARLEAINAVRAAIHYDCGADMARALNRALDLTRPFKEGA